jgi:hypothetical protein
MEVAKSFVKSTNGSFDASMIGSSLPPVITPLTPSLATTPRPSVDPHSLAHRRLPKQVRAVLGAEILDGHIPLMNPTTGMVVQATGVSSSYIAAARRLSPEQRQDVVRGMRPLIVRKAAPPALSAEQRLRAIVAELGGVSNVVGALNKLNDAA